MADLFQPQGGDLFIVDNSDKEWKVQRYLRDWTRIAHAFDIATGYFEIGSLLALDGNWQNLKKIRILMGDQVSKRTRNALLIALAKAQERLDESIEHEKQRNDFLDGVPAIVEGLSDGKIECRIYNKAKFHAKAYITHAAEPVIGSTALVGSSNFTYPGLTENVELNVQIRREVPMLQEWFERHWVEAEDVTPEILKTIERHTREYPPFDIYAKALQEFFRGHEMTASEWELAGPDQGGSRIYPVLDQYQREGYQALMKIARKYRGAFLCDGVGLGKTFIGMMVIERLVVHERKRVALFVPKASRDSVWEAALKRYLPNVGRKDFSNLSIFNHTDLQREGEWQERLEHIKEMADAIVIDEAHHFRNPGVKGVGETRPSRYRRMFDIVEGKELFLLTATPVNNRLIDLQHMIELFTQRQTDYFEDAPLGIHSLRGHFRKLEKDLERLVTQRGQATGDENFETNEVEAEEVLFADNLVRALVVQRSRAYVKESQIQEGATAALFPVRQAPQVVDYSIKKTFGRLLDLMERAFEKQNPLFSLAIYYPLHYYKGPDTGIDPWIEGRQKQVVALIRTNFLKRFESSARAFDASCQTLALKLLAFITRHSETDAEKKRLERWKAQHAKVIAYIEEQQRHWSAITEGDEDEDLISDEMLEDVEFLSRDEYDVSEIIEQSFHDLDQLAEFLDELRKFKPRNDDKLKALIKLLKTDPVLTCHKVLIFSEYMATARYLREQLKDAGIEGVNEVDSATKGNRANIIRQFAPYYNESSSGGLAESGLSETRVLISTDVLSEGLNLQDATRLINYDLHWNPVRLMQRIGRIDRRLTPDIEEQILADHPDRKSIRGTAAYWNFLPPDELDDVLRLYKRVSGKTLRISKTFGIEGRKLLKPTDEYDDLRDFNHLYEGTTSLLEKMHLEFQQLHKDYPDLTERLNALPGKVFSGKAHPSPGSQAVFFCYALPAPRILEKGEVLDREADRWTEEAGQTGWYLFDLDSARVIEEPADMIDLIRCDPEIPRKHDVPQKTLSEIRAKVEKHIKNSYLKKVQAPVGVKPTLKAWMELS